ncbi:MAG: pyruvate:ferredoxin (flavodoxin) oxidoreductase, partial [Oscillospiraceae bacterium]|nr:pyruvate:ferredoxin (flavodoxin) oxidoreductase [Oscillospiraceae bacterium]
AFMDHADGSFEQGASAFMKSGIAVSVPKWEKDKCLQCNLCSFVCSHAAIRPYALTEEEAAACPENTLKTPMKGKGKDKYSYAIAVSTLDCMGCGVCVEACHVGALKMVSMESRLDQMSVWNYMVKNIAPKADVCDYSVRGSQFRRPLLEFSGACAGCAETAYARLVTQLYGERMFVANATGCSSIWGGSAAASPYTVAPNGKGVAWANSLFEDNAEYGLGMFLGQRIVRDKLRADLQEMLRSEQCRNVESFKNAAAYYLETFKDGERNGEATDKLIVELEKMEKMGFPIAPKLLKNKDYLSKKSVWIFGGDGWAYDIGFGGLDHVLASGEDVNILVFDTEVYSNTGGQSSKASNIGQVAQFAAAGKNLRKKSLGEIAMTYGNVYVAQIAMGANPAQTLKAIREAESYVGPSLIIAYSPCEMHSIRGGMSQCQKEMKRAVDCGYWNLFRYDPTAEKPFSLDGGAPGSSEEYVGFLLNEARYSSLQRFFPGRATGLFEKNYMAAEDRYAHLERLRDFYNGK